MRHAWPGMAGRAAAIMVSFDGSIVMPAGTLGVWKTVNASSNSRNLSALALHPNSPLLATGTASQVGRRPQKHA